MDKKEIESPPSKKSEIQDVSDKMKELDELKNTFIALVSHELRTSLNLLKWLSGPGYRRIGQ